MAVRLEAVSVFYDGALALDDVTWTIEPGQHWIVIGPNGCGKTTLLQIIGGQRHPSSGTATVLGRRIGRTDVRELRKEIGYTGASLGRSLRPQLTALEVVATARHAALEPWWHTYSQQDWDEARDQLEAAGCGPLAGRTIGTLSEGERQRVLLVRTFMARPGLVVLDEPAAGLDAAGRELLVAQLARLAADSGSPPMVLVTHHTEEIPPGFTHVLLLRGGRVLAAGPLAETLTAGSLSACVGLDLAVERRGGRYFSWLP
ncbi:MAG: iron complex transport system ATP-binding protein [Acidimicrobiaceae bacterium]|nr:iron complex transport system ATP-binding protein [Acidimicrobiaceae bacterium]